MCVGQADTTADRLFCCECFWARFQSCLNGPMCGLPCPSSLVLQPETSPLSGGEGGKSKKKKPTTNQTRNFIEDPAPKTCSQGPEGNSWRRTGLLLARSHVHPIPVASCAQVLAHTGATCSYRQYKQIMDVPEFSCGQSPACFKVRQQIPVCAGGTTAWFRLKWEPKA